MASAAVEAGRCAGAVTDVDAITARGVRRPTVVAVIALRRGRCLLTLGRLDEAAALTTGIATVGDAPAYPRLVAAHIAQTLQMQWSR